MSNEVIQFSSCAFAISSIKFKQNNQPTERKMTEQIMKPVYIAEEMVLDSVKSHEGEISIRNDMYLS